MSERWRLADGHYFCDQTSPPGPGFEATATDDGYELVWGGRTFAWDDTLRRYVSLSPLPEVALWTYGDGTWMEHTEPDGPDRSGTWRV